MGGIRRIRKQLKPALADTNIQFNGCRVFLGHPNPDRALGSVPHFAQFMQTTVGRASMVNMHDLYGAHFMVRQALESGDEAKLREIMN